jgi:hypothetical protein
MFSFKNKFLLSMTTIAILINGVNPTSAHAASRCQNIGDTQSIRGVHQVCMLVNGLKVWKIQLSRPAVTSPSPNQKQVPVQSNADIVAQKGCSAFWPAVQAYQRNMGNLIPLGEVNGYFLQAKLSDSKYIQLWNAFGLIVSLVQSTPTNASDYDKQNAIDLFNQTCHLNLSLG